MKKENLAKEVRSEAIKEIDKYGSPPMELFKLSEFHAVKLAKLYNADFDIVKMGCYFADYKLGLAFKENRLKDHIKMSLEAASGFFKKHNTDKKLADKVLHCIEAHHGTIPYKSIEAEIVANADCYKFLTARGLFAFVKSLSGRENMTLDQILDYCEEKAGEKWSIASLPEVKKELENNHMLIKKLVKNARGNQ